MATGLSASTVELRRISLATLQNAKPTFKTKLAQCWDKYGKKVCDEVFKELMPWDSTDINADLAAEVARKIAKANKVEAAREFETDIREAFLLAEERGLAFESTADLIMALYDRCFEEVEPSQNSPLHETGFDVELFCLIVKQLTEDQDGKKAKEIDAKDVQAAIAQMGLPFEKIPDKDLEERSFLPVSLTLAQFASLLATFVEGIKIDDAREKKEKKKPPPARPPPQAEQPRPAAAAAAPKTLKVEDEAFIPGESATEKLGEMPRIDSEDPDGTEEEEESDAEYLWLNIQSLLQKLSDPSTGDIKSAAYQASIGELAENIRAFVMRYAREQKTTLFEGKVHLAQSLERKEKVIDDLQERLEQREQLLEKTLRKNHQLSQDLSTVTKSNTEMKKHLQTSMKEVTKEAELLRERNKKLHEEIERLGKGGGGGGGNPQDGSKSSGGGASNPEMEKELKSLRDHVRRQRVLLEEKQKQIVLLGGDEADTNEELAGLDLPDEEPAGASPSTMKKKQSMAVDRSGQDDEIDDMKKDYDNLNDKMDVMLQHMNVLMEGDAKKIMGLFKGPYFADLGTELDGAKQEDEDDSDKEWQEEKMKRGDTLGSDDLAEEAENEMEELIFDRVNRAEQNLFELQSGFVREIEQARQAAMKGMKTDEEALKMKEELERVKKDRDAWRGKAVRNSMAVKGGEGEGLEGKTLQELTENLPMIESKKGGPGGLNARMGAGEFVAEQLATQRRVSDMQGGAWMFKLGPNFRSRLKMMRNFTRTKVRMWLSDDFRFLYWAQDKPENKRTGASGKAEFIPKSAKFIPLEAVTRFEYGENSRAFRMQEYRSDRNPPHVCFSIYTVGRSLDLVTHESNIESWILGLNSLIPYNPGRTFYTLKEFRIKKLLLKVEYGMELSPQGLAQQNAKKGKPAPSPMDIRQATKEMLRSQTDGQTARGNANGDAELA